MKRKLFWWVLAIGLLVLTVLALMVVEERSKTVNTSPGCYLMSEVELCYRPQDVLSTRCIYDRANNTYLRFIPSETTCTSLNHPGEPGILYTRMQWTSTCGNCPKLIAMDAVADESPLDRCYTRCRGSLLLNFDWCAQTCRCALGYDICSTGGQLAWTKG